MMQKKNTFSSYSSEKFIKLDSYELTLINFNKKNLTIMVEIFRFFNIWNPGF